VRVGDDAVDARALGEERDLVGDLEGARSRREELAQREELLLRVVPAHDAALRLAARDAHVTPWCLSR
jgi:hypothetical protein